MGGDKGYTPSQAPVILDYYAQMIQAVGQPVKSFKEHVG